MDMKKCEIECKKQVKNMFVLPPELLSIVAEHLDLSTCRTFSKVFSIAHGVFRRRFSVELGSVFARVVMYGDFAASVTIVNRDYRLDIQKVVCKATRYRDNPGYCITSWKHYEPGWPWTEVHEWICKEDNKFGVYSTLLCPLDCNICRNAKKCAKWVTV